MLRPSRQNILQLIFQKEAEGKEEKEGIRGGGKSKEEGKKRRRRMRGRNRWQWRRKRRGVREGGSGGGRG